MAVTRKRLFTSESVTEGHPDKVCDQISDAILDELLRQDPQARVACETLATTGLIVVTGEITASALVDAAAIARRTLREIGYDRPEAGFDANTCGVVVAIDEQSPDIAQGVNQALEARSGDWSEPFLEAIGAGDQGMMFGYATDETPEFMPLPIAMAHRLARRLAQARKSGLLPFLRPDGKTQVTVEYGPDDRPLRLDTVVISAQHGEEVSRAELEAGILEHVIRPVVPPALLDDTTRFLVNPTGRFVRGGPQADTGLTGRKVVVDTYGGMARHGGGAFSGKDPTKVDRSGAYAARYVAKNLVAAGLARRCEIQVAYAIGVARPISLRVETYGTGVIPDDELAGLVERHFDLRPGAILRDLDLRRPIYRQVAAYGHFGRDDLDLPWERTDRAEQLRAEVFGVARGAPSPPPFLEGGC